MATEKIKFKLELYSTMWDKAPMVEVCIDEKSLFANEINGTIEKPSIIEFEHTLVDEQKHELIIKRSGKTTNQTVINEKGDILHDQLLHIKRIEIDEIDIGSLVYNGVYTPQYPEPWATQQAESGRELKESFTNVTVMGFNGQWKFTFTSPFYMWLLENLY